MCYVYFVKADMGPEVIGLFALFSTVVIHPPCLALACYLQSSLIISSLLGFYRSNNVYAKVHPNWETREPQGVNGKLAALVLLLIGGAN